MLVFKLELVHEVIQVNEVITGPIYTVSRRQRRWRVGMNGIVVISYSSRQAKSIVYFMIIFSGTKLLILPGPIVWDK
jgi:hypothetical protein